MDIRDPSEAEAGESISAELGQRRRGSDRTQDPRHRFRQANIWISQATSFQRWLANGRLRAYHSAEYFKDFGTPDRLAHVRSDFETGKTARLSRGYPRPAVFLDRDGVINKEVSHLSDPAQMELIPGAAEAIRRLNEAGFLVIVVTNQPVVARGECTLDVLRLIHNKMETLLGREHAWIDALYFCPHHPDKGFAGEVSELKVDCVCRKPKTGMFDQAVRDWNISLSGSYGIGDSRRDVIAARRMGIGAIGVKTGHGCRDCDALDSPDRLVEDLREAVDIILASRGVMPIQEHNRDHDADALSNQLLRRRFRYKRLL